MDKKKRIASQIAFLTELDKLKAVLRANLLCDSSRNENSGEHSWHVAVYALILAEHSANPINIDRVVKMLLIHDIVEIDSGDYPIHGNHNLNEQADAEQHAAKRIFGILPSNQSGELYALWQEFEKGVSNDAIFAKSIDRVQPVVGNLENKSNSWTKYKVTAEKLEMMVGTQIKRGVPDVWNVLLKRIKCWFLQNKI